VVVHWTLVRGEVPLITVIRIRQFYFSLYSTPHGIILNVYNIYKVDLWHRFLRYRSRVLWFNRTNSLQTLDLDVASSIPTHCPDSNL